MRTGFWIGAVTALSAAILMSDQTMGPAAGREDGPSVVQAQPADRGDITDPEDGAVAGGTYANPYFGLTYPLLPGWTEGLKGPPPSFSGYYVLATLNGDEEARASILLVAQDLFFAAKTISDIHDMARSLRDNQAGTLGMSVDGGPTELDIAGHSLIRVDYSGSDLYRVWLAETRRCHVLIFNVTATTQQAADAAARDVIGALSAAPGDARSDPVCVRDYAVSANVLHRIDPAPVGPKFVRIPARILIGTDGRVTHVHVISGSAEQKRVIAEALRRWRFRPYLRNGTAIEVETGLEFEFKSDG
jgi:hypothetical protein